MTNRQTEVRIQRRRRLVRPPGSWVSYWLPLLLLGLAALAGAGLVAANWIEDDVLAAGRSILTSEERAWAQLKVQGQTLIASGQPPSEAAGAQLVGRLERSPGSTLLGDAQAPRRVVGDFTKSESKPCVEDEAAPAAATIVAPLEQADFKLRRRDGVLLLAGAVATADDQSEVLGRARALVEGGTTPLRSVEDSLRIDLDGASPKEAWFTGIQILGICREGRLEADTGRLEVLCVGASARHEEIRALLADGPLGGLFTVETNLLSSEAVDACESGLAEILGKSVIEFDTASANIRSSAFPLLDEVAAAAKGCPGRLRIEGHTDRRGSAESNLRLSEARAGSVVDALESRGLARDRLRAQGFGESKPLNEGRNAVELQQNRRIEIHVIGS